MEARWEIGKLREAGEPIESLLNFANFSVSPPARLAVVQVSRQCLDDITTTKLRTHDHRQPPPLPAAIFAISTERRAALLEKPHPAHTATHPSQSRRHVGYCLLIFTEFYVPLYMLVHLDRFLLFD